LVVREKSDRKNRYGMNMQVIRIGPRLSAGKNVRALTSEWFKLSIP